MFMISLNIENYFKRRAVRLFLQMKRGTVDRTSSFLFKIGLIIVESTFLDPSLR